MSGLLEALWYARSSWSVILLRTVFAPFLWPLTVIFDVVVGFRRSLFRSGALPIYRARCPVVVIGNLSVGGTGKTPLVIHLANRLAQRGLQVGIVTRGYGGRTRGVHRVGADSDPREMGDEACLLARETSVIVMVAAARGEGARALEQLGVSIILSDDGLQHYALARDVEIAVIDEARGLGNGWLLPAGPLREGRSRLLSVDWLVLHGEPLVPAASPKADHEPSEAARGSSDDLRTGVLARRIGEVVGLVLGDSPRCVEMRLSAAEPRALIDGRTRPWSAWSDETVYALAGIGRPERFFAMLAAAGITPQSRSFPDHHVFTPADMPRDPTAAVLMTSKDAVKCRMFADSRMWEVPVSAQLSPRQGEDLVANLWALCQRDGGQQTGITPGS